MKVLVVEDNDFDRTLFLNLVQRYSSCDVDSAVCIAEARERIAGCDLVILDLKLPEKTGDALDANGGKKVLEHIRSVCGSESCPKIVVVSQFREDSLEAEQIRKEQLFGLISAWFHKLEDRQRLTEFISELAFSRSDSNLEHLSDG